jgi:methyl-accepting chemotaxis protein
VSQSNVGSLVGLFMHRSNITVKIWLSVGVFILGFVLSTAWGQIRDRQARASLRDTSEALFPAAQRSQEAESAFQRMVKGFAASVVMQDASGLDRAIESEQQASGALRSVAAIGALGEGRRAEAGKLANELDRLAADARRTYATVLSGDVSASTRGRMRELANWTEAVGAALIHTKEQSAADLHQRLSVLEENSARQSRLALGVFLVTLMVACVIVHLTIRRSITGPVVRVIGGVRNAANEAATAASHLAQSGMEVSDNAREQAACIQQTSASLEEISSTTHKNADRAGQADRLMQEARHTGDRASRAMQELSSSMGVISKSSNQVAGVLKNIDMIAFHTNILALNAAVEAARAGDAGAGFSIVADEVGSLAHRTAEAARNSGAILEQTMHDVSQGVALVTQAHLAFEEVSAKIASGTEIVSHIAASSAEQSRGITAIGQAINRMEALTQRNVTNAERTADGASAMTAQVESTRKYLDDLVGVVGMRSV